MRTDNFRTIRLDKNWEKDKPKFEEGAIYYLQALDYEMDTQCHRLCFEKIGEPIDRNMDNFHIDISYV